ncbi:protein FAR-RED IMPAIRED RESPONSE 1-like [Pyrus communis]|uniref:protein FAR-RED IMPAIRED RESPONSE 1-like n=1 Tax=Pyrus communis TaxID=23211 RepID=UPI0035C1842A
MSSSQRVESGHSFFKKYVSKRNSLWDFVTRFERALGHQRHKELVSDHVDVNEVPKLKTLFPIEKEMRGLYTKTIFLKFQDEVIQSTAYLKCDAIRQDEKECVYVVIRADAKSSTLRRIVHDKISSFARCSCRKFEFEGIPCGHIVFFLRSIHIVDLPSQYIMKRWTKSVKAERIWDGDGLEIKDVQYKSLMMRHIQLSQLSQCLIDESFRMEETTKLVRKGIESLRIEVKGLRSSLGVGEVPTKRKLQKHMINEPAQVKAKGSGKGMKSSKEKAMGKAKKYKACGGLGHTIRQSPISVDG